MDFYPACNYIKALAGASKGYMGDEMQLVGQVGIEPTTKWL